MLQGRWPLHLLTSTPLPQEAFVTDVVSCQVSGYETGEWKFTPIEYQIGEPGWFELEFNLPETIANLVADNLGDRETVANIKQEHFSYINLTGVIGEIQRSVKLELNREWIRSYIDRVRQRA